MALNARQKQIIMYMQQYDEDLAIRKKTMKWKLRNLYFRFKKKVGLI